MMSGLLAVSTYESSVYKIPTMMAKSRDEPFCMLPLALKVNISCQF